MKAVQDHRAQKQCVAADREEIGEVEGEPVLRADDHDRIGNTLRPREERHEVSERATTGHTRADRCCVRRETRHEHDERRNQRRHQERHVGRARVMNLRGRERLVQQVDRREDESCRDQHAAPHLHTDSITRSSPSDVEPTICPVGQRQYPSCVAREGKPRLRTLEDLVALPRRSPLAAELEQALAAASRLHGLRSDLAPVPVRPTATITEAGAYRFRKRDPIDLRVSRVGGRAALGFLHELGHLLDHQIYYDRKTRSWASAVHVAFTAWRTAAATLEKRPLPGGRGRQRYFQSVHEVWARSYAQTVLLRSADPVLQGQLEKLQAEDDVHVWSAQQFEPVATEVERVFERLGLTQLSLPLAA